MIGTGSYEFARAAIRFKFGLSNYIRRWNLATSQSWLTALIAPTRL